MNREFSVWTLLARTFFFLLRLSTERNQYCTKMEELYKQVLERSMVELTNDLEPHHVMPRLIAEGVMRMDDIEEVNSKHTRPEKVCQFIMILKTRGQTAYPAFLSSLEDISFYKGLTKTLRENELALMDTNIPGTN